jgi:DNA-binding NarL/FixJ family response regulator
MENIRVLVADDHEAIRDGFRYILGSMPGWEICGEAADGRKTVDLAVSLEPDIVIMDIGMPGLNGTDATRQMHKRCPGIEILVFTAVAEERLIHQMIEAGARGYIFKTDNRETIEAALRALAKHRSYFTSKVGEVIFDRFMHGKDEVAAGTEPVRLTPREREIVQLLAEGKSNKGVALALGISPKTAETHRAVIMKKLRFDSFADLVRYAIRNNIASS